MLCGRFDKFGDTLFEYPFSIGFFIFCASLISITTTHIHKELGMLIDEDDYLFEDDKKRI